MSTQIESSLAEDPREDHGLGAKYLRNCWYVAGHAAEATRAPMARVILEEPILIYRTESGEPVAMSNRCAHRFAPLNRGKLVGDAIQCPYHGLRFDRFGKCIHVPFSNQGPASHGSLKTYPLVERHKLLWIWMGTAGSADSAKIPDFSLLEREDLAWYSFYLHAKANYQLLIDNLLDLSHTEFLHPMLSSPGWCGRAKQTVRREGDTVYSEYIAENDELLKIFALMKPTLVPGGNSAVEERWDLPSVISLSTRYSCETGGIWVPSGHFLTPETALSTHYFVIGGHDHDIHNEELRQMTCHAVQQTFATEDLPIIEGQQQNIGVSDLMALHPMVVQSDSAAVRARRVLRTKIREESSVA